MRKTIFVLSILTAAFATSTAYLAYELYQRDSGETVTAATQAKTLSGFQSSAASPAENSRSTGATSVTQTNIKNPAAGDATRPGSIAAAPANAAKAISEPDIMLGFARQFLARYDDVNQRPVLLEETRTVVRRQYEKLKEKLHLSDSAFEQLTTLLAEEQLQGQAYWARCAADPACDPKSQREVPTDHTQEYQAMLGPEGAEAFTQYRNSIGERDAVIQLRGRLPDISYLPEAQAEKLIAALAEEREQFYKEATARGAKPTAWGTNLGMLWYTEDSGLPEQYVAEASQFSQRLRARATGILTPAQLAAYEQMQDELLAQFNSFKQPPPRQNKSSVTRSS